MKNGCSLWLTYVTFLNNLTNSIFRCKAGIPNIIKFADALKAFTSKLSNSQRKIRIQNYLMFEKLDILHENRENKLSVQIENGISKHLSTLESEFERHFPEITNDEFE